MQIRAIALDAFGTVLQYGQRLAPYSRLLAGRGEGTARLPFLTRNVPVATFAAELGLTHLLPDIEADLAEELAGLRLFAEVPQMLEQSREAGLRLAVCSNLAAEYGPAVLGLLPDLDAYVLSYEVGLAKPDPAIFQRVCDALGCEPGEVVFVGDSKRCDVDGPRAFSMQAHHLDRKRGQTLLDVMDDVQDLAIAEQRLADIRAGKSKTVPLDDVMQMFGDAYDALKANPGAALSPDQIRARLAAQGGQAPDMADIPRRRESMTRDELLATVPVRRTAEGSAYVALADIPAPWRHQFEQALHGSSAPAVPGVGPCAWLTDWQQWVMGNWHRDSRAEGLQP